ncbi:hypothetical protein GCM10010339_81640 [Streptomyces alanosinicus]|uniref:Uncharacterized protein n=1 Tax=Streptomyces alanosinicus TaxID=68171 RepID=A0A918YS21_9ACTN|nr:hypothetical protein GCM10010339_81640 [Streptomyces alanosinicus]
MGADLGRRRVAEVLPQEPAVADLHRFGQSPGYALAAGARAIAADDLDAGVLAQPPFQGVGGTAREDVDALASLGVGQDGGVAVAALEREVIDAKHTRHSRCG